MKVIDNSPVFEPAEGVLVVERHDKQLHFEPNRYYVTNGVKQDSLNEQTMMMKINDIRNVNHYKYGSDSLLPDLSSFPNLQSAVRDNEANVVLPLSTPFMEDDYFIVAKFSPDTKLNVFALMAYSAERITKHCMQEAVKAFALSYPDEFEKSMDKVCNSFHPKKKLQSFSDMLVDGAASLLGNIFNPTFGMAAIQRPFQTEEEAEVNGEKTGAAVNQELYDSLKDKLVYNV